MNVKQTVNTLWREFREAINQTYLLAHEDEDTACLRDYAENISWNDDLAALLGHEIANERQHRSRRPSVPGFSNETASKLILMTQVSAGAAKEEMPRATAFLVFRKTAVEAQVIGFLIRKKLTQEWHNAVNALDYVKLMQAGQ